MAEMRTKEELHQRLRHLHHILVNTAWSLPTHWSAQRIAEIKTQMNELEWVLNED